MKATNNSSRFPCRLYIAIKTGSSSITGATEPPFLVVLLQKYQAHAELQLQQQLQQQQQLQSQLHLHFGRAMVIEG